MFLAAFITLLVVLSALVGYGLLAPTAAVAVLIFAIVFGALIIYGAEHGR